MLLVLAQVSVAWWITVMSSIGVWLPLYCVRRSQGGKLHSILSSIRGRKPQVTTPADAKAWLSFANCLSAGMLLTMALLHFFPESFEVETGARPNPQWLCFWLLVGLLIPAIIERSMKGGGAHSHGVESCDEVHVHDSEAALSNSVMLIILMCFHGITEGLLLGYENKTAALLSAAIPLSIHKFCDGLVIGVSIAKELKSPSEDELACDAMDTAKAPRNSSLFWRRVFQGPVGIWLLLTPLTVIGVVLWNLFASSAAAPGPLSSAPIPVSSTISSPSFNRHPSAVTTLAAIQAVGSGSFVYIGLKILNEEDLRGVAATVPLLLGVSLTAALFLVTSGYH